MKSIKRRLVPANGIHTRISVSSSCTPYYITFHYIHPMDVTPFCIILLINGSWSTENCWYLNYCSRARFLPDGIKLAFLCRGGASVNSAEITGGKALLWYYYRITRLSQLILPRTIYPQREGKKERRRNKTTELNHSCVDKHPPSTSSWHNS